jgi:hypothetical protein
LHPEISLFERSDLKILANIPLSLV